MVLTVVPRLFTFITLFIALSSFSTAAAGGPQAYTNHTVGEPTGWSFNSGKNTSEIDYSKWASSKTFFLGDFLLFKTKATATIIQTANETTYKFCSVDDDDNAIVYTSPSPKDPVAVPLTSEGQQYFISGDGDGIECEKGMKFGIKVQHGRGLPPSLNQPPPPPYEEPSPPPEEQSTAVPATTNQGESFYNGARIGVGGSSVSVVVLLFCFLLSTAVVGFHV